VNFTVAIGTVVVVVAVVVGGGRDVVGAVVVDSTDVVVVISGEGDDVQAVPVSVTARSAAPKRCGDLISWQGTRGMETPTFGMGVRVPSELAVGGETRRCGAVPCVLVSISPIMPPVSSSPKQTQE
jgi:hypothetical protein